MFNQMESSPFELEWRMLGIDIRVSPWFWLIAAFLGWGFIETGWQFLVIWIACVFVSILIHEMGHVLVGRIFGTRGSIYLHGFGGLAIDASGVRPRWQRVLIYLAGPFAGFLFFAVIATAYALIGGRERDRVDLAILYMLFWINLVWGLINLLPVFPLDGGQVSREFFTWIMPRSGMRIALGLSAFTAAALAVFFLFVQSMYAAVMFGLLAFNSMTALQEEKGFFR